MVESIIRLIVGFFSSPYNAEQEKHRLIKENYRKLRNNPYSYFYNYNRNKFSPYLGKFIYNFYIVINEAKKSLSYLDQSQQIKDIIVEYFLERSLREFTSSLDPDTIKELMTKRSSNEIRSYILDAHNNILTTLANADKISEINFIYQNMMLLFNLINLDYIDVISRFDRYFKGPEFNHKPVFSEVDPIFINNFIEDFYFLTMSLPDNANWDLIFTILTHYRNTKLIEMDQWRYTIATLNKVLRSNFFTYYLRHLKKEPFFNITVRKKPVDIIGTYLQHLDIKVNLAISILDKNDKSKAINNLIEDIFYTANISTRLKFYTKTQSDVIFQNAPSLAGFMHAEVLNVLVVFSEEYLVRDIREFIDFLIMKGKWSQNSFYRDLTNSLQDLNAIVSDIVKFDTFASPETTTIKRLKNAINNIYKDKLSGNVAKSILSEINEVAYSYIASSLQLYIILMHSMDSYITDYQSSPESEIIINWKELERSYHKDLMETMDALKLKIDNIVNCLLILTS